MKVILAALACIWLAGCLPAKEYSVTGRWQDASGAAWEFTADGKVTIKGDAKPTYEIPDKTVLRIEFHDHQSLAVTYKYELTENKLILTPEEAKGDGALPQDWDEPTVLVRQ